jgi:hypothetical protein
MCILQKSAANSTYTFKQNQLPVSTLFRGINIIKLQNNRFKMDAEDVPALTNAVDTK